MHAFSCHMHMHTCSSRGGGGRVRGGCGATGAVGQAPQQEQEIRENPAQGPVHPGTEQQPEGKPRCIT